jgi:hypothetical protein
MGTILLWVGLGVVGLVSILVVARWLDKLLLRAEEKGWIYYRKRASGGFVSNAIAGVMTELDQIIRPSAEYRIEAEDPAVEEDEKGGE